MTAADTSSMLLSYVEEVTFGTMPGTALTDLRWTSESLKQETGTTESQEIRSDRQITDVIRTGINAAGDINWEFSYGAFDAFFRRALLADADWTAAVTDVASAAITADGTNEQFVGVDGDFTNYVQYQWVLVSGFTNAANNGLFKIKAISSSAPGTSDDDQLETYADLTQEAGTGIDITQGSYIEQGTSLATYSIEKHYTDLSNKFEQCLGLAINTFSMNVATEAIITGTFGFIGKSVVSAAATGGTGTNNASPTNNVMNAIDNVTAIYENQSDTNITGFSFSLNNNLRARLEVGTLGAISLGKGTINLTGTVTSYFEDETIINKYLNFTASSLALTFNDADSNKYVIEFPQVKYTDGQRVGTGQNNDVIGDLTFTAYRNTNEDTTIRMARFPSS